MSIKQNTTSLQEILNTINELPEGGSEVDTSMEDGLVTGFANELWLVIKCSVAILLLFYIVSIPMQLVSYFIILVIKYFQKYGYGYKKVFRFFLKTWRNLS